MEKYDIIIVCFVQNSGTNPLLIRFYDYDLNLKKEKNIEDEITNPQPGYGSFFKIVYCKYEFKWRFRIFFNN